MNCHSSHIHNNGIDYHDDDDDNDDRCRWATQNSHRCTGVIGRQRERNGRNSQQW